MRPLLILLVTGMAYGATAYGQNATEKERPAGSPGTATPHPFVPPVPRDRVEPRLGNPPLLKHGPQDLRDGNLAPRDSDLPLLEQQRQRNRQKPKEQ
nr:hypothetical protein [uncultured Pseudomonas sp.]